MWTGRVVDLFFDRNICFFALKVKDLRVNKIDTRFYCTDNNRDTYEVMIAKNVGAYIRVEGDNSNRFANGIAFRKASSIRRVPLDVVDKDIRLPEFFASKVGDSGVYRVSF